MKYIFNLSFVFCFLGFAQNIPIDSIPFKLEKRKIYIPCKVNQSDTLYFMLDTGATDMVLNSKGLSKVKMVFDSTIENFGTTGKNILNLSTENTFSFGNQNLKKIKFITIPNKEGDGIIGLSVLRQYIVKIDYDSRHLILYHKKNYQAPHKNKVKFKFQYGVPFIQVTMQTIDGKTRNLKLELDTGSDRIIDISANYANKHKKLLNICKKNAFAISKVTSSDGKTGTIYNVYFPKVKISDFETYKIPGGIADQIQGGMMNAEGVDGIIGNWYLKRFNLIFDFENNNLYLEPNNYMYTPFYEFLTN